MVKKPRVLCHPAAVPRMHSIASGAVRVSFGAGEITIYDEIGLVHHIHNCRTVLFDHFDGEQSFYSNAPAEGLN